MADFGDDGLLYAMASANADTLWVFDVTQAPGDVLVDEIKLVGAPLTNFQAEAGDVVFSDGFLWSLGANPSGGNIARIDPNTGAIDAFDVDHEGNGFAGAAFRFGNGDLGFSHNGSGNVTRMTIDDPAANPPTFNVITRYAGPPPVPGNDGAGSIGPAADLALTKSVAPTTATPGGSLTWTISVENLGGGDSTGWLLTDTLPAGLTGITAVPANTDLTTCSVAGTTVTCERFEASGTPPVVDLHEAGSTETITVTATLPADLTGPLTNSASVTGNDPDPNPDNNTAFASASPPAPTIVDQTVDATCGTDVEFDITALAADVDPTTVRIVAPGGAEVIELVVPGEGTWSVDTTDGVVSFVPEDDSICDVTPIDVIASTLSGGPVTGLLGVNYSEEPPPPTPTTAPPADPAPDVDADGGELAATGSDGPELFMGFAATLLIAGAGLIVAGAHRRAGTTPDGRSPRGLVLVRSSGSGGYDA